MTVRTILDTDIGTDVDDCLALSFILGSPEIRLEGITCVYGDVQLRARMVRKLLRLRGLGEVPVTVGASRPLLGLKSIYWEGHEGEGLLDAADMDEPDLAPAPEHAVDFIVRTVLDNPGQIHLLAIGPLANVALALVREPLVARHLAGLTIMGGVLRGPGSLDLPFAEHNIVCDPEAAHVVLSSGAPITLVPLDVTTQVRIGRDGLDRLRAAADPFHDAVARQLELYPRFARDGGTFLHDPLTAAVVVEPGLVGRQPLHVAVETQGRLTAGLTLMRQPSEATPANARVALTVDAAGAEEFILSRMTR